MKYMLLIKHEESLRNQKVPQALMDAMGVFVGGGMESGVIKDTAGLTSTSSATEVRLKGGKMTVVDGPFTESKEIVGGFAIIDVPTRDEALKWTNNFVDLHRIHWPECEISCELRPFEDM